MEDTMTKVKICGLRRPEDAQILNRCAPDYAGTILARGFRRSVAPETAALLRKTLSPAIPLVGVFVDNDPDEIARLLEDGTIDIAQLHGGESDQTAAALRERTKKPIWKVFKITETTDFTRIENCPADLVLLDAGTGTGQTFDWTLAKQVRRPFILAGGLTPANAAAAIAQTRPFAVDTSSGVETDGTKDEAKIAAFIRAVRETL